MCKISSFIILALLFLNLNSKHLKAQINSVQTFSDGQSVTLDVFLFNEPKDAKIDGSPYLDSTFQKAQIKNMDEVYLVRYNVVQNLMEVKMQDKIMNLNTRARYEVHFMDTEKKYEVLSLPDGKLTYGLVLWANEQGFKLIEREMVIYIPGRKATNGYERNTLPKYESARSEYFLQRPDQTNMIHLLNKKEIIKMFSDQGAKAYVKKEKIKLNQPEGMIQYFQHFLGE